MFCSSTSAVEAAEEIATDQKSRDERVDILAMGIQNWCQEAAQAMDEGELKALEFLLGNEQAKFVEALKPVYDEWQQAKADVEEQRVKVQELTAQVSAERKILDEGGRIPTPKEKELRNALNGVKREIMELSGYMRKVHDLNTALEESERAGSAGRYDHRSLEELQAQVGRARNEVASYEREHGDILTLNQQFAAFRDELESERQDGNAPNASRLKDLETQLDQAVSNLDSAIHIELVSHRIVRKSIARNLGMEEMMKWIRICIDGRRQQLAAAVKPAQSAQQADLIAATACWSRQGPFSCTGLFRGGSFKMRCHNLKDNMDTTSEGEAVFRFGADGMVDVVFFKDGTGYGGLGAGKITPSGGVEVSNYISSDGESWKGQFTLQPMAGSQIGPVGRGTFKISRAMGDLPAYLVCEGELSLPAKKK